MKKIAKPLKFVLLHFQKVKKLSTKHMTRKKGPYMAPIWARIV